VLVKVAPLLELMPDWAGFLRSRPTQEEVALIKRHERTGRPLGSDRFVRGIEKRVGRMLHRLKPGPKPKLKKK